MMGGGMETIAKPVSYEQRRSRRRRLVPARTINVGRLTKHELALGRLVFRPSDVQRPRTRGECEGGARPCPFVSCKHNLYLDVSGDTGAIKMNFPDLEVWEMGESCALDVADNDGETLENVGGYMNLTRERIRQIEVRATRKLKRLEKLAKKRRLPLVPQRS
jgi:hypothetical protein